MSDENTAEIDDYQSILTRSHLDGRARLTKSQLLVGYLERDERMI
jgi:hypothetical protein